MGRYYNGDIDGKFMFAVQSSMAADRFGATAMDSGYVSYYFDEDNLTTINEQLETLEKDFKKVEKFFVGRDSWSQKDQEEANISSTEMSNYADYRLGKQILDCVTENGHCNFEAEL